MKNHLAFLLIFVCTHVNSFSQQLSFPITYDLNLNSIKDRSDHRNNPEEVLYAEFFLDQGGPRESKTITYTRFYPDMIEMVLEYFVKHIEVNKTVKNYTNNVYYSGIPTLSRSFLKDLNDPAKYKKWGGYYLNLASNDITWKDGFAHGKHSYSDVFIGYDGSFSIDTVTESYPYPPYDLHDTVYLRSNGSELIAGLGFQEFWNFNANTGNFSKDVQILSMSEFILNVNTAELRGVYTPLMFKSTSNVDSIHIFKKNMKYDVFFDNWNSCTGYDKSKCEDLKRELASGTSTRNSLQPQNKAQLFIGLMKAVKSGNLIALDARAYDNKQEKILSIDEVYKCITQYDTAQIMYPYPPYDAVDTVLMSYLELEEFIGMRFMEDWSFEPVAFNFYKKIKVFGLLSAIYNDYGALAGYKPMFYLKPKNQI